MAPAISTQEDLISLPNGKSPIPKKILTDLYLSSLANSQKVDASQLVAELPEGEQKRIIVTGGAGFVGSHLVDRLLILGHKVTVIDNYYTGARPNVQHWIGHPNFQLLEEDIVNPIDVPCDRIYHLACPASPPHYQRDSIKTVEISVMGTSNMLALAKKNGARILLASTSEVYGDPEVHPQTEDYWGHVNPIGIRACYDEGKRCGETLAYCYERQHGLEIRVARIFNTYGPRMDPEDGRVVSNFIMQALQGKDISVYGDGNQTRSFQYVHDLVSGLMALMESNFTQPINLGNPEEYQIKEFATIIKNTINSTSKIVHFEKVPDDPQQRRPNIERAKKILGWSPEYDLKTGLEETIEYFRRTLATQ